MMKVYTGGGDRGQTSLFSGERVSKGADRIEAYGTVDELSSVIGALAAHLPEGQAALSEELQQIQRHLFDAGALLAVAPGAETNAASPAAFDARHARWLETAIDRMSAQLPALRAFILPGGHPSSAWCHVARTVCRRCERLVVRLAEAQGTPAADGTDNLLVYINRLSDYCFVLARWCDQLTGTPEITWQR
jgi:cob(I)alamin adenosyltransferase